MSARDSLWYMVFIGFAVNYMIRLNINIGIVSMVKSRPPTLGNISHSSVCVQSQSSPTSDNSSTNMTTLEVHLSDESRFDWDEKEQGLILASFFWFFWVSQVPGGLLAQRYGTKIVYGFSNGVSCLLSFFVPVCARLDYRALVFLRALQGFINGASWPAMHSMAAKWIPPNERSKFVSSYMGSSVGAAITYPLCGFLINWFDWPSVYYVTGVIGVVWIIAWWLLVYDSPSQHPRISETEKNYILNKLGKTVTEKRKNLPTPWREMLLSRPMWMNILAQWGNIWGLFTLSTQAPTYFKLIHGWDIRMTGFISGMPHLGRTIFAILMSSLGDCLLRNDYMSRTNVRKLATATCCIGQGVFMLGLAFSGCNSTAAIVFSTVATSVSGAVTTGPLASLIDLSPNFASVMLGITNMITVIPGFISPVIVGYLTYENQTVSQWQLVFIIVTIMLLVTGILYIFFSTSDLQEWNSSTEKKYTHELQKLDPQQHSDRTVKKETQYVIKEETYHKTEK